MPPEVPPAPTPALPVEGVDADFWSVPDDQPVGFPELATDDDAPLAAGGGFGPGAFGGPPVSAPLGDVPDFVPPAGATPAGATPSNGPTTLDEALPEGAAFEAGLAALVDLSPPEPSGAFEAPLAPPPPPPVASAPPAPEQGVAPAPASSPPDGAAPATTPRRVPNPPLSGQRLTSAGLVQRSGKPARPASQPRPEANGRRAVSASQRSPEEVQAMLSRYRSGLAHGRQAPPPPSAEHPSVDYPEERP